MLTVSCRMTDVPVMTSLADHLDVPSSTDCLTAFMCPPCDFFSTLNTFLQSNDPTNNASQQRMNNDQNVNCAAAAAAKPHV